LILLAQHQEQLLGLEEQQIKLQLLLEFLLLTGKPFTIFFQLVLQTLLLQQTSVLLLIQQI
jgi:hypothetical protein